MKVRKGGGTPKGRMHVVRKMIRKDMVRRNAQDRMPPRGVRR